MTTMVPMSRRLRLVPSSEITLKATRLSSPVIAMAAAITNDAAISATAGLVKPSSVTDSAAPVPSARSGCAGSGATPSRKVIKRHQHDRACGIFHGFGHPNNDREDENAEHVLTGDRKPGRLRHGDDGDERSDADQQAPEFDRHLPCSGRFSAGRCGAWGRTNRCNAGCNGLPGIRHSLPLPLSLRRFAPRFLRTIAFDGVRASGAIGQSLSRLAL